jgi:hypothetical protein
LGQRLPASRSRHELAQILALIWRALRPAGYFYASYNTGDADGRDTLNRYYNYPSPDWLRATYAHAGNWNSLSIETGDVTGFDGKRAQMLFVTARKGLSGKPAQYRPSNRPEDRHRQHGLRQEADDECQRAEHRQAEGVDDQMRNARPEIDHAGQHGP